GAEIDQRAAEAALGEVLAVGQLAVECGLADTGLGEAFVEPRKEPDEVAQGVRIVARGLRHGKRKLAARARRLREGRLARCVFDQRRDVFFEFRLRLRIDALEGRGCRAGEVWRAVFERHLTLRRLAALERGAFTEDVAVALQHASVGVLEYDRLLGLGREAFLVARAAALARIETLRDQRLELLLPEVIDLGGGIGL